MSFLTKITAKLNLRAAQQLGKEEHFLLYIAQNRLITVKQGNFDWWGNSDQSASFVKGAMVPTQECIIIASAFMEN